MGLQTVLELRRKRAALVKKAGGILTAAHTAKRELSGEELARFNAMHADADKLLATITEAEEARRLELDPARLKPRAGGARDGRASQANRILRAFVLGEPERLRGNDVQVASAMGLRERAFYGSKARMHVDLRADDERPRTLRQAQAEARKAHLGQLEQRALGTSPGSAGGFARPEGFVSQVEVALLAFGGMREVASVVRTADGNDLPMPTVDDTSSEGVILKENTAAGEQDVAMGQLVMEAYLFSSKMVKVSLQLLQDEAVNIQQLLGNLLGTRIARALNRHTTVGSGAGEPRGIVPASTLGKTAAGAAALTRNELVDLKHSVDPAYRVGARWMFADSTLAAIKKLVDSDGRPLWQAGIGEGEPDRLDGDPYVINQHMAAMASGAKSVVYGDLSKYLIRDVLDVEVLVLRERFAEAHQVAFLAYSRHDGDLLDAGTHPVKHLVHP